MTKRATLIGALLITSAITGAAWAATSLDLADGFHHRHRPDHARRGDAMGEDGQPLTLADNDRKPRRHGDHHERHHDDDDDDHGGRAGGAAPLADPNDPAKAVPDNGLFGGKTRPKVEVQ